MNKKIFFDLHEIITLAIKKHKSKNFQEAKKLYTKILEKNPNNEDVNNNLGILYNQLGEYKKAKSFYEKTLQLNPSNINTINNLGLLFQALKNKEEAMECFKKAIRINPNYAPAYFNFANTLKEIGEYEKAINYYKKTIEINPNFIDALNNLGILYNQIGEYKKAINFFEQSLQLNPKYIDAHNSLGILFDGIAEYQKAINCFENALAIEPFNLTSHWLSMNTFPVIYKNSEEIIFFKNRFKKSLKKISKLIDGKSKFDNKQLLNAISSSTNFYLHYQGIDVLEFQLEYASLIEKITNKIYKNFHKERKKNNKSKYIKIGFVSSFIRDHTVSKLFKNWIFKINKNFFRTYVYYCENKIDHVTNKIQANADHFYCNSNLDNLINKISKDNLDILIYLDIGMKPKIQVLSSLRLAPIQCNTYGHPVTSGFKNIDYFISSELMETKDSQQYYSEKLIKLPGLGINYTLPNYKNIKKPNIIKKSNAIIFLNLQNLFKMLPKDDHIYLDIIKKHPNSCFWFIQAKNNLHTSVFKERISKLFKNKGYEFEKYSYFHPKCNQDEFFGIIKEADIILDSLNWSGGNTSLEAIGLDKPIVTCPSKFMRGRYTYAILKILGMDETIAKTKEEYVEIAVNLARNVNFRNLIINKIKNKKTNLFDNKKSITSLENIIRDKLVKVN